MSKTIGILLAIGATCAGTFGVILAETSFQRSVLCLLIAILYRLYDGKDG